MSAVTSRIHRSYLVFIACTVVFVAIRPRGFTVNQGISYYGQFKNTLLPYGIAFVGAAAGFSAAAEQLVDTAYAWLRVPFHIFAIALIGLLATPHRIPPYSHFHIVFGAVLFAAQFVVGWALALSMPNRMTWLYVIAMTLAGLVCFDSLVHTHGVELQAQVVFQLCFWGLSTYVLNHAPVANEELETVAI